MIISVKW